MDSTQYLRSNLADTLHRDRLAAAEAARLIPNTALAPRVRITFGVRTALRWLASSRNLARLNYPQVGTARH